MDQDFIHIKNHLPSKAFPQVLDLIQRHQINISVVNQRKTKHGDFRKLSNGHFQITINNNLNPYQFLLTLIHEIAHHITFKEFGYVKPHGNEWKATFQKLMLPFLRPDIYPDAILGPLAHYLKNPKASTDSDVKLSLALKENKAGKGKSFIFDIPLNAIFIFKNKKYKRGSKRKTRYECLQLDSNRLYLFNQNTEVILYEKH